MQEIDAQLATAFGEDYVNVSAFVLNHNLKKMEESEHFYLAYYDDFKDLNLIHK